MPRPPRVHLTGVVYFVTLEGSPSEPIFRDSSDYQKYLCLLAESKRQFSFKLFSYSLLPSRISLLIETHERFPLSQVMQKITPLYTKYFNSRYGRKGPLFPKRFRSVIVEKEAYLPRVTRYLHLVPVRSHLVQNPRDYPFTSYRAFIEPGQTRVLDLEEEVKEVLSLLGDSTEGGFYEIYLRGADEKELEFLDQTLTRGVALGSDAFVSEIKKRITQSPKEKEKVEEEAPEMATSGSGGNFSKSRVLALSGLLSVAIGVSIFSVCLNQASLAPVSPLSPTLQRVPVESVMPGDPKREIEKRLDEIADLANTVWEVELIAITPDGKENRIKDRITFVGQKVESHYFSTHGFGPTHYTVTVQRNGVITWETIQRNDKGEILVWRGDWQGKKMEGFLSYRPPGENPQDFSFMSGGAIQ